MMDWHAAYRPLIGQPLAVIAWMPIFGDTPGVVAQLDQASFSFSGGVLLVAADDAQLFLTWQQIGMQFGLVGGDEGLWRPNVLDRIHCSFDSPWGGIVHDQLTGVQLFACYDDDSRNVVGVRHVMGDGGFFWIGCGGERFVGDGDDLWVGAGVEPPNRADLVEVTLPVDGRHRRKV